MASKSKLAIAVPLLAVADLQPCTRQKGTFRFFVEGKFSILGRRARALRPLLSLLPFQSEGQKLQGKIGLGTSIKHVFCPRTLIKNVFAVGHYNSTSICCWTLQGVFYSI